jgi:tRNA modification GTPase
VSLSTGSGRAPHGDTIVAIATPAGQSAVGVIRVSGPAAIEIVAPIIKARVPLDAFPSHALRRVVITDSEAGEAMDDALCAVMRAPRSYTGEEVVELSCHGSPALLGMVVRLLIERGARLAEPGEFTRRAFVNGKIDLARAEAVALMISARTERAVALAARAMAGGLSEKVRETRDSLLDLMAGLEVTLDFPEEHVGLDPHAAAKMAAGLRDDVGRALASVRHGRVVHEGLTVALVGPPNAGKSSLLNALLGSDRAIVSPVAGTTRDIVEGTIALDGVPVRLLDTAGIGDARDPIEEEGIRRSRRTIEESDLLLVVFDGTIEPAVGVLAETRRRPRIIVLAKSDRPPHASEIDDAVRVSALSGAGMDRLVARLTCEVRQRAGLVGDEGGIVASLRQLEALEGLHRALLAGERALAEGPVEVALVDLSDSLRHASGLLGLDVADSVLDRVFAAFCLGK